MDIRIISGVPTADSFLQTAKGKRPALIINSATGTCYVRVGNNVQAVGGSGGAVAWGDITGKPSTFTPSAHTHPYADAVHTHAEYADASHVHTYASLTGKPTLFSGAYADLTGKPTLGGAAALEVGTTAGTVAAGNHTHAGGGSDPFIFKGALAANASTGANVTPISLTGLVFTFEANATYLIDIAGATQAPAATTGGGFHLDTSVAVTRVGMSHVNQLANAGTITGGSSIADDVSVGVSSGRPSANVDTPIMGSGYLVSGASGGTAQLRYRSEVAAVSTVMAGFVMRVMKV